MERREGKRLSNRRWGESKDSVYESTWSCAPVELLLSRSWLLPPSLLSFWIKDMGWSCMCKNKNGSEKRDGKARKKEKTMKKDRKVLRSQLNSNPYTLCMTVG